MKVLLNSFHLDGYTQVCLPQTQISGFFLSFIRKLNLKTYLNMCFPFTGDLLGLCHICCPFRGLESPGNK